MIVTLAGHVDHGKTAIVHALTGTNTDRLAEEKARGLTIDLGFAYATMDSHRIGFVDVPGHTRFIHNMIAGVASNQHALLVIAADDGIMPQTIEHAQILELLGVRSGTIVINKVDLVPEADVESLKRNITTFASTRFLQAATVIEVSATNNLGIYKLRRHLLNVAAGFKAAATTEPFRLAIDRSFSLRGIGTIVTGTVTSGTVRVGDEVHLSATDEPARIRGLNVQGEAATAGSMGDRCSLNIAGRNVNHAQRGHWLTSIDTALSVSRVSVDLSVLEDFPRQVKHWSSVHVYHLTDHCEAKLALLEANSVSHGKHMLAELHCESKMQFKAGDRLLIRDRDLSRTLGGATVLLTISDYRARRRTSQNVEHLDRIRKSILKNRFEEVLFEEADKRLIDEDSFRRFCNHDPESFERALGELDLARHKGLTTSKRRYESNASAIQARVSEFHSENPKLKGITFQQLEQSLSIDVETLTFALDLLAERGEISRQSGQYSSLEHQASTPDFDTELFMKIESFVNQTQPMSLGDISKTLRIPLSQLEKSLSLMVSAKVLVRVANHRYLTPERVSALHDTAKKLADIKPFSVKEFRDESGLGRNVVIEILEYFDRQRITKRTGDTRRLIE